MSLMEMNNLSFLTYGALGLTGVILAIATAYETSDDNSSSAESPAEPEEEIEEKREEENEPTPKPAESSDNSGLFDISPVNTGTAPENGLFSTEAKPGAENERIGGKKKKRRTK